MGKEKLRFCKICRATRKQRRNDGLEAESAPYYTNSESSQVQIAVFKGILWTFLQFCFFFAVNFRGICFDFLLFYNI